MVANSDYQALMQGAAFIDFSSRGRLCLIGADRQQFLNGQVTNSVKNLNAGQGCYAALANAKGKMTSDLFIYNLGEEILLDFEAGFAEAVKARLEKFIIADDVQVVDATGAFGLLTILGPKAREVCGGLGWPTPEKRFEIVAQDGCYFANTPRLGDDGVDVFFPVEDSQKLVSLRTAGIIECGPEAFETVRIEQGIPRFGADMDENTLVPEAIEHAISYNKGCYIGQEVIARIRTYGQVAKALRGLRFASGAPVPKRGDKILNDSKEAGAITSAVFSPKLQRAIALGYVRKECNQIGSPLMVNDSPVEIVPIPFQA